MKELSIEEKAKRYDEAIQRARNIVNSINVGLIGKDSFEAVFPELKESEDEKIRKELVQFFEEKDEEDFEEWIPKAKVLAWLEKKGEQKYVPAWMPKFLDELRSKKNYFDWDEHRDIEGGILAIIKWMNPNYFNGKDDGQKPTDKIEPRQEKLTEFERAVKQVMEEAIECGDTYNLKADAEMLLSLAHNSSWNEEDEARIMAIDLAVNRCLGKWHCCGEKCPISEHNPWLKCLKDRLLPQNTWKPSDEQIKAVKEAACYSSVFSEKTIDNLISLSKDLKKLKG